MKFLFVLVSCLALSFAVPLDNDKEKLFLYSFAETTLGKVMGTALTFTIPGYRSVNSFFGIPYGQDTSGENRFKKPVPAQPWSGTLDVASPDRLKELSCLQIDLTNTSNLQGTEDCLRLNVYTPKMWGNLPVMVYLHGGGFIAGDGQLYNHLKLLNEDVVLVVIQYRLGVLGFLSTHTEDAPGNMGMYDQLLGMKWVKENIANFGGDPNRITLWGESAGATSVGLHIVSPLSTGLFHNSIIQSGGVLSPWSIEEEPLEYHRGFGDMVGCEWDETNAAAYVACLRNTNAFYLIGAQIQMQFNERLAGRHGFRGVSPIVEKYGPVEERFMPYEPINALAEGNFNRVPSIVGCTKHEGTYPLGIFFYQYIIPNNYATNDEYIKYEIMQFFMEVLEIFDETSVVEEAMDKQYLRKLPRETFFDVIPGLADFVGATLLKAGAYSTALLMAKHEVPVWFYHFEYKGEYSFFDFYFPEDVPIPGGITHGDELLYMFAYPSEMEGTDAVVSERILGTWADFAAFGTPNPASEFWPQFSRNNNKYLRIGSSYSIADDFSLNFNAAMNDLENGIPIPTKNATKRALNREKLAHYLTNIETKGQFHWTEEDEKAVHASLARGGSTKAKAITLNMQ